ncbi:MAG: FliA/WhiG family RNA polymerase sigma factor [Acidimicrobiales bacterium]
MSESGSTLSAKRSPATPVSPVVEGFWSDYKSNGGIEARNRLVLHYASLVKFVAGRLASGLPNTIEQSDLVSYGMFGLINAIDRFDPAMGNKFETYAVTRIRGAILDELRALDWVPRSLRAKSRTVQRAYADLEAELGRTPTEAEVAKELGLSEEELADVFAQISFFGLVALEETLSGAGDDEGTVTVGDTLADPDAEPGGAMEEEEGRKILAAAISRLGEREKLVLTLYYYENLTLADIGSVLGVTESRVCQIHSRAVIQLRAKMGAPANVPRAAPSGRRRVGGSSAS